MKREYPARREWTIPRPRLDELFKAGLEYPLVTVIAGPGYGKTTAVMDFCRDTGRKLVWLHLLPPDNEPECFWNTLLEALEPELPELAGQLSAMKFPDTPGGFEAFLRIIRDFSRQDTQVLCVLDCAECIDSDSVRFLLDHMIKAERENLCIILISNRRQQISGLIGDGRHFQVGPGELRFNEREIAQLYEQYGRPLTPAEAARVGTQTDGWPLALHLLASNPGPTAPGGYGEIPHLQVISELFEQHYYASYHPDLQRLLVQLSFFEHVSLGLIQVIGVGDIVQTLGDLTRILFISYDYTTQQFYFQKMYRDFLSLKQEFLTPGEVAALMLKAGRWLHSKGRAVEALDCFWQIGDYDSYLEIILGLTKTNYGAGVTNQILECLGQFPAAYREAHEEVDFCRGYMYINNARVSQAKEIFLELRARLEAKGELPREKRALLGTVYSVLVVITFLQNTTGALEYVDRALELLPGGAPTQSDELMAICNNEIFFLPDNRPGALERVCLYKMEFAAKAKKLFKSSGQGASFLFLAEAAYFAGRFADVLEYSLRAIYAARETGQYDIMANATYLQMRMALFQGDNTRAEQLLVELTGMIDSRALSALFSLRDCAKAHFYLRMHDVDKIPPWLYHSDNKVVLHPLDTGRDKILCALCRYVAGDFEAAYFALLELDALLADRKLWSIQLVATLLRAACQLHMGDGARAVEQFWQAYDMTWQNSLTTCFAEYGRETLALLELTAEYREYPFDEDWLEKVREESHEYARRESAMVKRHGMAPPARRSQPATELTPREREVMALLSQGLNREEIGALLGISLHGVKKHITNIYNKLGAVNRVDAIQIAVAGGLLDDDGRRPSPHHFQPGASVPGIEIQ